MGWWGCKVVRPLQAVALRMTAITLRRTTVALPLRPFHFIDPSADELSRLGQCRSTSWLTKNSQCRVSVLTAVTTIYLADTIRQDWYSLQEIRNLNKGPRAL